MSDARRSGGLTLIRGILAACCLLAATAAQALTQDVTGQFAITRSGLVLNRTTNTFDSTVTLKNSSGAPILAPIDVAIGGLPAGITLANKTGDKPDGRPYVSPMAAGSQLQNGATLTFALKYNNPARVSFSSTLQILRTVVEAPANAPSLLGVVATGGTSVHVIGRVDGAANQDVALQLTSADSCIAGTLVNGASVGGTVTARTDAGGYFQLDVSGVNPGAFVALKNAAAGSALSLCQVSGRDNDSWPKAFLLEGSAPTARDPIDTPGKARWYKFAVTPGQRIDLKLSGLPADYDLAVFKDIAQAFASQFNPVTAGTNDLLKLTAEYAPSTFSPSTFSPSTFSPSTFSPDAYSPSTFSPSTFSPSVFSPSTFSPSTFSPSTFSPSTFSPSTFSPSTFSPSTFSPSTFSPSTFSAIEIAQAFSTAQTRSIVAVSATAGLSDEATVVNTWNRTGDFYVRVTGRGGAFNTSSPFTLTVTKGVTTCVGVTDTVLTPRPEVAASGLKTVLLTDSSKVALDAALTGPAGGTLRSKLAAFAARSEVGGVVVDVAGDARVTALKQQAASHPACPFAKNLVAEEIKGIVDTYRANPLQYVVIVGNDDAIPFFRSPDQSVIGKESGYVPPVQSNSPSEASLRRDFVLSQDKYGSKTSISLPWNDFPVPGLAVGRLIETAGEIAGLIDAYVAADSVVSPRTSLVTGYDFLEDAAIAVKSELDAGTGAAGDALITPNGVSPQASGSWTAKQLNGQLFGSRHDIIFLAGHFSANSALAADFATSVLTTDLVASTTDFTNSIVFSAGCHAGYNLVDGDAIPEVTLPLDWAQAFARKRATLIAGTGYQYGDTDFLEYSERLYNSFARQLRAGSTGTPVAVGEALVRAKLAYLAATPDIRGLHEKALLQTTLFGLPMLAVNMPSGRGELPGTSGAIGPALVAAGPAATLGLQTFDLGVSPSFTAHTQTLTNLRGGPGITASWFSTPDGVVAKPGEPALPLAVINVTPNDAQLVLRGIGYRGGSYVDAGPMVPFTGAATTESRGVHVAFLSPVYYPTTLWTPNYFGALSGSGGTQLLVTPVQHRAASVSDGTSTQRRHTALNLRLYYSGNLSQAALSDAPSILAVDAQLDVSGVTFAAQVIGDPAAAIHQVWVTYTGDGSNTWTSLDLSQCVAPLPAACGTSEDSRVWKGRLASPPANIKYFVQAVNGVGLVARNDNYGAYFGINSILPTATTLALVSPPSSATVGDRPNVTARLSYAGGVGLAGKIVAIGAGGASRLGTTGTDGSVTVSMPVVADPGNYQIIAAFAGDDVYQPSSASAPLAINRAAVTPTVLPSSPGAQSAGINITGALGSTNAGLQGVPVTFTVTVAGNPTPITVYSITDYLGNAIFPPPSGLPPGNYTVTQATFSGDGTYTPTTITFPTPLQISVPKLDQGITFAALAGKTFGAPDFGLFASASSNLIVSYTASGACTVAGNTVHLTGTGSCTIDADQAGDATYNPAVRVTRTFAIAAPVPANNAPVANAGSDQNVIVGQSVQLSGTCTDVDSGDTLTRTWSFISKPVGSNAALSNATLLNPTFTPDLPGSYPLQLICNDGHVNSIPSLVSITASVPAILSVTSTNDSGPGSLRDAVALANLGAGPNTITFAPGMTGTILLTTGQIRIDGPLAIVGPGRDVLAIDGNLNGRIFTIVENNAPACPALSGPSDYVVSISGLTLKNGSRNVADSTGGAIQTSKSLILDAVTIRDSQAKGGGGLAFNAQYPGQVLTITNSLFIDNVAKPVVAGDTGSHLGGAIRVADYCLNTRIPAVVVISMSEFAGNRVQPVELGGSGGAIALRDNSLVTISDTLIEDNHAEQNPPQITGHTSLGGAIASTTTSVTIERSEIVDNSATFGGGLWIGAPGLAQQPPGSTFDFRLINSTVSANTLGGGIVLQNNVSAELDNSTIADNVGSGIYYFKGSAAEVSPTLKLVSSVVGRGRNGAQDVSGGVIEIPSFTIDATNSLLQNVCGACSITVSGSGNLVGVDPLLGPLADNGGTSRTHALLAGSPAINAGANPLALTTDQRGAGFVRVTGAAADMGAYESSVVLSPPSVSSLVRAVPNPTMADTVTYTLTFSQAVIGVTSSNFAIAAGGINEASVTGVTGGGTTWTVTVDTGRGTGSLHLDVVNGTGITNTGGTPLAGTPFTGETYNIDKGGTVIGTGEGQLLTSFGNGGYALFSEDPNSDVPGRVRARGDGRILAAGAIGCVAAVPADPISPFRCTLQLAQYTSNGAPDGTFGTNGRIVTAVTNVHPEVNLQILGDGTAFVRGVRYNGTANVPFVAMFTAAGAPTPSFGTNGVATLDALPVGFPIIGTLIDSSGRVVVVATTPDSGVGEREDIFVTRLTSAGATDTSFGTNGVAQFALSSVDNRSDRGSAMDIQPDGKILIGGRTRVTSGAGYDFLLMRIDANGVRDPSFGTNGVVTTRFSGSTTNLGRRFVLEPDGKVTMVGTVDFGASNQCGVARFTSSGTPDPGFGTGGLALVNMNTGCFSISQQTDGKFVIVGNDQFGDVSYGTFARLLLNGSPDPSFGTAGVLRISSFASPTRVQSISSGTMITGLAIEDPADGIQKMYVVELAGTLAGPYLNQTIAFDPILASAYGNFFTLPATASSGLAVSYAASGACTVDSSVVQLTGLGNCTITASQGGNATFFAATPVPRTFAVAAANQAITFGPAPTGVTAEQLLVMFAATSSSPMAPPSTIPIVFDSLTPSVCTTPGSFGSSVNLLAAGTCTIAANQAGNAFYNPAPQATLNFAVGAALPPPTTFLVTNNLNGGAGSLREAINQANMTPGLNAIAFVGVTGSITLTSQITISGPLLITGPGADQLTISSSGTNRIFSIGSTFPACPALDGPDYLVSISGLRLSNAKLPTDSSGGAIYTEHSLALDSMKFDANEATRGAGVAFFVQYPAQTLSITNSLFFENTARDVLPIAAGSVNASGGGLTVQDKCNAPGDVGVPHVTPVTVTIANSEFRGNSSQPVALNGRGGAIRSYSLADITITDTVITENHVVAPNPPVAGKTYHGGGIDATAKSLRIERSEISGNSAFDVTGADVVRSGALHLHHDAVDRQGPGDAMAVKIINSTISGNSTSATPGALLAFANVAVEFVNSTISDNGAPSNRTGGIIVNTGATSPVSGNNAARPTLSLVSSILANNSSSGGDVAPSGTSMPTFTINATNSLIEKICVGGSCSATSVAGTGNLTSVGATLGPDPLLGPLAYNGGATRTRALLAGSPAINAGSNLFAFTTDQRGAGFPRVVGGAADMGAYESGTAVPLTNFAYLSQFGSFGSGDGRFSVPVGVAIDPTTRDIVVVDSSNHRVQRFDFAGSYVGKFGSVGSLNGQFSSPYMAAIDPTNHNIAVTDLGNNRVQIFNAAGGYQSQFGSVGTGDGQFQNPVGVLITPSHETLVVDHTNNRLQFFDFANTFEGKLGSLGSGNGQFNAPDGVALDTTLGHFIVADTGNNRVQVFDGDGNYLFQFGMQGSGPGQFNLPSGIAVDPTSHNIIVADNGNNRVQIFNSAGVYLSQFGTFGAGPGQFNQPYGVAIDPVSHNIVVVDQNNNRVQIFVPQ